VPRRSRIAAGHTAKTGFCALYTALLRGMRVATWLHVEDPGASKSSEAAARSRRLVPLGGVPWARLGNLALGLWLQISSFAWQHTDSSRISAWLPGLLISVIALLSMSSPPMRWLNGVLGLWLIAWTVVSASTEPLTYWNGVVAGLLVMVLSTIGTRSLASDYEE
jgi:hypothetical protein